MHGTSTARLMGAAWLFALGSLVHLLDHLRRGQGSITEALYWAGNLALVVQVVVITLLFARHRQAPRWAAVATFPLAVGFFAAHWLPEWSALSDPIWQIESWAWFSAVASWAEILGAVALGLVALRALRQDAAPGEPAGDATAQAA